MKTLTTSSLNTFRACPRMYFYGYELKRVSNVVSEARSFGSLMHTALEHWWKEGPEAAVDKLKSLADVVREEDAAKICALLAHYKPPVDRFEVAGVEQSFDIPIQDKTQSKKAFYGYRLAGKIDLVLVDKDTGYKYVCDHKTTSDDIEGFGPYWQILQVDAQMINYCLAIGADGFIYDVMRKPTIKLCGKDEKAAAEQGVSPSEAYMKRCEEQMAETPDKFYQWREYVKALQDMDEARTDLWHQVEMFRFCDNANRWPRYSNSCKSWYGSCEYLEVCAGRADIENDEFFRSKESEHEELNAA